MLQTEPRMSAYLHGLGDRLGLSVSGTFELTSRCNFSCPMCYVHSGEHDTRAEAGELTAQQWIDIAREAKDRGLVFLLLTGGEPFVRRDFFEIYDALKAMGLMISINSNGSMLSGEILRRLIENPPMRMNISLYGGCRETYRRMCGRDAFDQVLENVTALKKAGIDVRLNVSVTAYNRQDLAKIYAIAAGLGVQVKMSSYMYPAIRLDGGYGVADRLDPEDAAGCMFEWDELRFTPEEMTRRTEAMLRMAEPAERDCGVKEETGASCRAGRTVFWITWDGRMLPCGMMTEPAATLGELGFSRAWDRIREETARLRRPEACLSCPKRTVCPACASVCYAETGAFDGKPEYMCRMTEALLRRYQQRSERIDENREGTDQTGDRR